MEIKTVGDVKIASILERFDAYTAREVESAFTDLVAKGTRKIICDFSQTGYIASAGLRVVLATAKNLQKLGGQLVLCCLKPYVQEVFDTAGFTQIFKIYNSTEDALKSLQ